MKLKISSIGAGLVTLLLFATPAYAAVGTTVTSVTAANVAADRTVNTTANAQTDTDVNVTVGQSSSSTTTGVVNAGSASSDSGIVLKLNASGVAVVAPDQVNSEEDLQVFSSNIALQNRDVASVNVSSQSAANTKVTVVYKHKGRLFGVIPVTVTSTTDVEAQTNAQTKMDSSLSWWSFLVTGVNYNKATLESHIQNDVQIQANLKVNASVQAKAQVAEALVSEIQTNAATDVSAQVK